MSKFIAASISLALLLFASIFSKPSPAQASSNGSQIAFSVTGGTIQYLVIKGTNQRNEPATWWWADAWERYWKTGAIALVTEDWWWVGTVDLYFYVTDVGQRFCHIDSLKETASESVSVTYDLETEQCSGEGGNAAESATLKAVLAYYLDDSDADNLLYAVADKGENVRGCIEKIAEGLASGRSVIYLSLSPTVCGGIKTDIVKAVLQKYNRTVTFTR